MSADSASPEEGEYPQLSRALLTPGAQPPLSHFGLTMMRHVVATGLRYALFQLGCGMPDGPPIRLVGLRLFLDRRPLIEVLGGQDAENNLLSALLDPAATVAGGLPRRLAGAVAFHRVRILLQRRSRLRVKRLRVGASPAENRELLTSHLRMRSLLLGDAVLGELLSVLRRQSDDRRLPSLGPAARAGWRLGRADLDDLGILDPLHPPWTGPYHPDRVDLVDAANDRRILAPEIGAADRLGPYRKSRRRGAFREVYRGVLTELSPVLDALRAGATEDGTLARPTDLFFVPFPLLDELTIGKRPSWLDAAVATNRAEYVRVLESPEQPQIMWKAPALEIGQVRTPAEWAMTPLLPVP